MLHTQQKVYSGLNGIILLLEKKLLTHYHGFVREENIGQLSEEYQILMEIKILYALALISPLIWRID
jgi:hypothetical protein